MKIHKAIVAQAILAAEDYSSKCGTAPGFLVIVDNSSTNHAAIALEIKKLSSQEFESAKESLEIEFRASQRTPEANVFAFANKAEADTFFGNDPLVLTGVAGSILLENGDSIQIQHRGLVYSGNGLRIVFQGNDIVALSNSEPPLILQPRNDESASFQMKREEKLYDGDTILMGKRRITIHSSNDLLIQKRGVVRVSTEDHEYCLPIRGSELHFSRDALSLIGLPIHVGFNAVLKKQMNRMIFKNLDSEPIFLEYEWGTEIVNPKFEADILDGLRSFKYQQQIINISLENNLNERLEFLRVFSDEQKTLGEIPPSLLGERKDIYFLGFKSSGDMYIPRSDPGVLIVSFLKAGPFFKVLPAEDIIIDGEIISAGFWVTVKKEGRIVINDIEFKYSFIQENIFGLELRLIQKQKLFSLPHGSSVNFAGVQIQFDDEDHLCVDKTCIDKNSFQIGQLQLEV
jgi:hypothetical protein